MIRAAAASLWAHKARMALTGVAVALGVAFVVGTLIFSDTLQTTFEDSFAATAEGVDVTVEAEQAFDSPFSVEQRDGVSPEVVERIEALDGVHAAEGEVSGYAQLVIDGEPVETQGPPTLGLNAPAQETLSEQDLREGRWPQEPGEIAVDAATAAQESIDVGDRVGVMTTGEPEDHKVTGTVGIGELDGLLGATLVFFDAETALDLYSIDGDFLSVSVGGEPGTDADELRDEIGALVGDAYVVKTGDEAAADLAAQVSEGLGFFTTGLLVFAGVSLFVGAFIIANTFSIVVAQRTRELALLRAVGATRRQVLGSVLLEAVLVGLVGSAVGIVGGAGLAVGLQSLLDALGLGLPSTGLEVNATAVLTGLVVGVAVTGLSSLAPALKATRIPPVAALAAAAAPPPPKVGPGRVVAGVLVAIVGVAVLAFGLFADGGIGAVGAGAGLVLVAAALLATLVARPVLALVGWPLARLLAVRGQLARENALRNPRRTAATASALMIGLGLVTFASIFGASLTRSAETVIDETFKAEYVVRGNMMSMGGISEEVADRLGGLDEVAVASASKFTELRHDGQTRFALGVDPATIEETFSFGNVDGSMEALAGGGLALRHDAAEQTGLEVGDEVEVALPRRESLVLPVRAVFDAQADVSWVVDRDTVVLGNREAPDQQVWVKLADGVDPERARPALDAVVDSYPAATLMDQAEQKEEVAQQVNQLLALMSALLVLSVLIALFGIVNTLSLSVFERTRELGLLRAVGASRRQVRAVVRWESVLICVLGAVLGLAVGALFGWLLVRALADEGLSQFTLPGGQLVLGFVAAALAGVLAAVFPARRAARVDVLRAVAAE